MTKMFDAVHAIDAVDAVDPVDVVNVVDPVDPVDTISDMLNPATDRCRHHCRLLLRVEL